MIQRIHAALLLVLVLGATVQAAPASAATCTGTGKVPVVTAQGFLATHYSVNCTNGQSWTVDATVQALVNGSWVRAGNTDVSTFNGSGDETVTAPVESGQWACTPGREYRSHAVLRGGNTDNSTAVTLC